MIGNSPSGGIFIHKSKKEGEQKLMSWTLTPESPNNLKGASENIFTCFGMYSFELATVVMTLLVYGETEYESADQL